MNCYSVEQMQRVRSAGVTKSRGTGAVAKKSSYKYMSWVTLSSVHWTVQSSCKGLKRRGHMSKVAVGVVQSLCRGLHRRVHVSRLIAAAGAVQSSCQGREPGW